VGQGNITQQILQALIGHHFAAKGEHKGAATMFLYIGGGIAEQFYELCRAGTHRRIVTQKASGMQVRYTEILDELSQHTDGRINLSEVHVFIWLMGLIDTARSENHCLQPHPL